jgi:glycosyltransferase involved in cell wall biosynthesis
VLPLRILQVISSAARSGAERHTVDLCSHLTARGHQVWAAVPEGSWLADELSSAGVGVVPCQFKKAGGLASTLQLCRVIKKHKIQVVHSHLSRATMQSSAAAKFTKTGITASVHVRSIDPAFRLVTKQGGLLIAVSDFIKATLVQGGFPRDLIRVIHNATDFGSHPAREETSIHHELGLGHGSQVAGVVGRIAKAKGQDLALRALAECKDELPHLHLAFIGRTAEAEYEAALRRQAEETGLTSKVHFMGERKDIVGLIDSLDLLLVPSEMESFGLAALEAMTRGKPVIAAKVGGLPEVVEDGVTGLVLPLDAMAWRDGLICLASDAEKAREMGRAGRHNAKTNFSVEKMVEKLEAAYNEVKKK